MDQAQRDGLIASATEFMERYHQAFLHGTRDDLQLLVHSPVIYITETDVQVRERYPFDPVKLRAATDFHHGETETRFVHIEPTRAHVLIEGTRHRADGSAIESIQSVYILQDRGEGWRVAAFSGIRGAAVT
ncbi:MAG: hypothetical protein ACKV2O_24065 [Acidimicrobiales bacterium]